MPKYKIEIKITFRDIVEIEAESKEDALRQIYEDRHYLIDNAINETEPETETNVLASSSEWVKETNYNCLTIAELADGRALIEEWLEYYPSLKEARDAIDAYYESIRMPF